MHRITESIWKGAKGIGPENCQRLEGQFVVEYKSSVNSRHLLSHKCILYDIKKIVVLICSEREPRDCIATNLILIPEIAFHSAFDSRH